jgi:hypothetical protein
MTPSRPGHDVTPATITELVHRYTNGETIEGLTQQYRPLSYRKVRTLLLDAGVTLRPPIIPLPPTAKPAESCSLKASTSAHMAEPVWHPRSPRGDGTGTHDAPNAALHSRSVTGVTGSGGPVPPVPILICAGGDPQRG